MMRFTGSSALRVVRFLATCVLLLLPLAVAASAQESVPVGEKFTYIVVLHDRPPKDGPAEPTEPDMATIGGEVLHQWRNRRVVRMSEQAVRALAGHRGVKYIQRVQMDGALPELPRSETIAASTVVETDWAPPSWSSGRYVYDGDGNITAIGTAASPASDNGTETYAYDSAGRLVSATLTHGSTHSEKYSYDAFGNLIDTVRTAGPSTATPVDAATNRLAGMTYDGVGNLTKNESGTAEYYYDGFNMLRLKVTGGTIGAWYLYTADDERIGAEENGEIRWMVRDLNGRVMREWEASGWSDSSWWLWREDYMHRGSGLAAAEREPAEGGTRHFHLDHLGTPRLITDANGTKFALHDYFPFGVERTDFRQEMLERGTDRPEPMKFTGHERDFTAGTATNNRNQLDYMHARYYSAVWGRFLSVDPNAFWGLQGGSDEDRAKFRSYLRHPQRWNRYAYVSNNPINKIDPDGREENFYMEQLFREQQMVGEGKMTEDQYWARRRSEGYGALIGTAGAGGWLLGVRAVTMGYTAFQAWRAASAAATTIKIIEQTSRGDARIFQTAMNFARGSANNFMNNLTALSRAVEQVVGPQGRITQIGTIGGQAVWGSARTGYGITVINGVTKIVQMIADDKYRIIGNFR